MPAARISAAMRGSYWRSAARAVGHSLVARRRASCWKRALDGGSQGAGDQAAFMAGVEHFFPGLGGEPADRELCAWTDDGEFDQFRWQAAELGWLGRGRQDEEIGGRRPGIRSLLNRLLIPGGIRVGPEFLSIDQMAGGFPVPGRATPF